MDCIPACKLRGYNKVHNAGYCYYGAPNCELAIVEELERTIRMVDDLTILDVPDYEDEDDDSIEDPSLP